MNVFYFEVRAFKGVREGFVKLFVIDERFASFFCEGFKPFTSTKTTVRSA